MIKHENPFVEAMKFTKERNNQLALKEQEKIDEKVKSREAFMKKYYATPVIGTLTVGGK